MPITHDELYTALSSAFPAASITLTDLAGDNDHWSVTIRAQEFTGKNRIAQHKLVQQAVAGLNIHALAIKTESMET